jgi:hypothetical protein
MGKRVYLEELTQLALLYNYKATGSQVLKMEDIGKFVCVVEENLEKMQSKVSYKEPLKYEKLIYFNTFDNEDVWYSIIKPGVDLERVEFDYAARLPSDVKKASKQSNALDVLGLKLIDDKFYKKDVPENPPKIANLQCKARLTTNENPWNNGNFVIAANKLENITIPDEAPKLTKKK